MDSPAAPARLGVVGALLALFLLHPSVFFSTYVYGQNDIVAASLILLALFARDAGRPALAGLCIGLAALEKFYPLAFAGFLMMEGDRRVSVRVPLVAAATFAAGMLAGFVAWGPSTFDPLVFGSARDPKMLSILRFLTCFPDLVAGEPVVDFLVDANSLVVLGSAAVAWLGGPGASRHPRSASQRIPGMCHGEGSASKRVSFSPISRQVRWLWNHTGLGIIRNGARTTVFAATLHGSRSRLRFTAGLFMSVTIHFIYNYLLIMGLL